MSKQKSQPQSTNPIRDRVKELRRVRAGDLLPNPRNWRTHPQSQRDALVGVLREIGYADALLARETPDGLMLVDGHLRAETTPEQEVPVLILDVTEEEADKILLTLDPLVAMAEANTDALEQLLRECQTGDGALATMLEELAKEHGIVPIEESATSGAENQPVADQFSVVVECADEADQKALYERLTEEGRRCRPLTL